MMLRKLITITGAGATAFILFILPTPGTQAQKQCPADRPCIVRLYQDGSTLVIGWDGHENFDADARPGRRRQPPVRFTPRAVGHNQIQQEKSRFTTRSAFAETQKSCSVLNFSLAESEA